jgi:hypothetical protein
VQHAHNNPPTAMMSFTMSWRVRRTCLSAVCQSSDHAADSSQNSQSQNKLGVARQHLDVTMRWGLLLSSPAVLIQP